MIQLLAERPWARQLLQPPAVYLDHWAVRHFSKNQADGQRLTRVLRERRGTLALSWANIAEFTAMDSNTSAASEAETFIEEVFPNLYFLLPEPFEVSRREDLRSQGVLGESPEEDRKLMEIVAHHRNEGGIYVPSASGMIRDAMRAKDRLEPHAVSLKKSVRDAAMQRLARIQADPAEKAALDSAPSAPWRPRATLSVTEMLLRGIYRMAPQPMTENDTFDLLHAAVPLAYCDFVLLDKKWRALAEKAIREMRDAEVKAPLANVYSGKKGDIEQFLAAVEAAP